MVMIIASILFEESCRSTGRRTDGQTAFVAVYRRTTPYVWAITRCFARRGWAGSWRPVVALWLLWWMRCRDAKLSSFGGSCCSGQSRSGWRPDCVLMHVRRGDRSSCDFSNRSWRCASACQEGNRRAASPQGKLPPTRLLHLRQRTKPEHLTYSISTRSIIIKLLRSSRDDRVQLMRNSVVDISSKQRRPKTRKNCRSQPNCFSRILPTMDSCLQLSLYG